MSDGPDIPKIYEGWSSQHWRQPEFVENVSQDREETLLRLRMVSLLPEDTLSELGEFFGQDFYELPDTQRIALVTASVEGSLTHSRLLEMTRSHPRDISSVLHDLVDRGMLDSDGAGRGTYYFIPGRHPVGNPALSIDGQGDTTAESEVQHKHAEVQHKHAEVQHKHAEVQHNKEVEELWARLTSIAESIASTARSRPDAVRNTILDLCRLKELSCAEVASLLNRKEQTVQNHYLDQMCEEGLLKKKYPVKHHPKQRYRAE